MILIINFAYKIFDFLKAEDLQILCQAWNTHLRANSRNFGLNNVSRNKEGILQK